MKTRYAILTEGKESLVSKGYANCNGYFSACEVGRSLKRRKTSSGAG